MTIINSDQVDLLLRELDRAEPMSFNLGTPEVFESVPVHQLVVMGTAAVQHLLECMESDVPNNRMASIAFVLGQIGDRRALSSLIALRARYQERATKDEWDYAVIGQCNLAVEQLQKSSH